MWLIPLSPNYTAMSIRPGFSGTPAGRGVLSAPWSGGFRVGRPRAGVLSSACAAERRVPGCGLRVGGFRTTPPGARWTTMDAMDMVDATISPPHRRPSPGFVNTRVVSQQGPSHSLTGRATEAIMSMPPSAHGASRAVCPASCTST